MSGVDYIKRIVGKGGDRIILDVEKSALTIVHGKDGKPCEIDCQAKVFEYKQEPTNPAFPTQVEYLEIGDVTHKILVEPMRRYSGIEFYPQEGLPAAEYTEQYFE